MGGHTVYRTRPTDNPPGLGEYSSCDPVLGDIKIATDWWDLHDPSDNGRHFWVPPLFRCQLGTPVGESCEWSGTFGGSPARTVTEVLAYETVSVPAGTFANAMKIRETEYENGQMSDVPTLFWFDATVGLIKAQEEDTGTTIVLISHSPPTGQGSIRISAATASLRSLRR